MYSENVSLFLFLVFHPFPFHCTSSPSPLQRGEKHCGQNKMPDRHVSVCPRVGSTWLNHPIPRLILLSPIAGGLLVFCTRRHVSTWWWVGHNSMRGKTDRVFSLISSGHLLHFWAQVDCVVEEENGASVGGCGYFWWLFSAREIAA